MGSVVDYFIPNGVTFSTMVTTSPTTNFKWTNDLSKPFVVPVYHSSLLGGSVNLWPSNNIAGDTRRYLSFWGGNDGSSAGGCCHSTYSDTAAWGKAFKIWIKEEVAEISYNNTTCEEIKNNTGTSSSGIYNIDPDGPGGNSPFMAYCDMVTDDGGWTLIAIVSNADNIFKWGSSYWRNTTTYNTGNTSSYGSSAKYLAYSRVPGTVVRIVYSGDSVYKYTNVSDTESNFLTNLTNNKWLPYKKNSFLTGCSWEDGGVGGEFSYISWTDSSCSYKERSWGLGLYGPGGYKNAGYCADGSSDNSCYDMGDGAGAKLYIK
jgi:hypothetical protein